MGPIRRRIEALRNVKHLPRLIVLGTLSGVFSGLASAAFLAALDRVTSFRLAHAWLLFWLPLAGLVLGLAMERFGASVKAGTSLVLERQRDGGGWIPPRMAPIVLFGTLWTHLFGGSAGREGTAVQMGAGMSDFLSKQLKLDVETRRKLIAAGVAGGFGSVFGTPWAGVIFAIEYVVPGKFQLTALVPCLIASFVGDLVTRGTGIEHTVYPHLTGTPSLTLLLVGQWALFALAAFLVVRVFIELKKRIGVLGAAPLRMFCAGLSVVALAMLFDPASNSLGLGVPTIVRAFSDPSLPAASFLIKLVLTAITVGAGFLGGEVTPLFFIGATLGNVLGRAMGLPLELSAAVGMACVFGLAANAPLALCVMAVELVGIDVAPHVVIVMVLASVLHRRQSSIYASQIPIRAAVV